MELQAWCHKHRAYQQHNQQVNTDALGAQRRPSTHEGVEALCFCYYCLCACCMTSWYAVGMTYYLLRRAAVSTALFQCIPVPAGRDASWHITLTLPASTRLSLLYYTPPNAASCRPVEHGAPAGLSTSSMGSSSQPAPAILGSHGRQQQQQHEACQLPVASHGAAVQPV